MELGPGNRRLFLGGALVVWLAAASVLPACASRPGTLSPTLLAWAVFGAALVLAMGAEERRPRVRDLSIAGQGVAALALVALHPLYACGDLLVLVGWQAALAWPTRLALALMALQTLAAVLVLPSTLRVNVSPFLVAVAGFQLFGLVAARIARVESSTRRALATALAEVSMGEHLLAAADRAGERRRIARDLHDALGHDLAGLVLQLDVVLATPGGDAASARRARVAAAGLLGRVREVVADAARPPSGDLADALSRMLAAVHPLKVDVYVDPACDGLEGGAAVAVMRLVQEGVTNALRHGGAGRVEVRVERLGDEVVATVRDDGAGAPTFALGGGLTGMRERLSLLGGRLAVTSEAGAGFRLQARLPAAPLA